MQLRFLAGSQSKNDSLKTAVRSLSKSNLCVIINVDNAANLFLRAHQIGWQCKQRIFSCTQAESTTPLKDLPAPHRHRWFVWVSAKKPLERGEHDSWSWG